MTVAEVRGTVSAYMRLRELLAQPLGDGTKETFERWMAWAEDALTEVTDSSAPARWARQQVGPVLAAGLGAAVWMKEKVPNPGAALRVFGLSGERPLSGPEAWKLVERHAWEPAVSAAALAEIRRRSGLRLHRLGLDPSPAEVLEELTRARSGGFPGQVAHWLALYFREHPDDATEYAALYRAKLAELRRFNASGEMALRTGEAMLHNGLGKAEWEEIIHGRMPAARLEMRAAYLVVRQLITDYWARWHAPSRILAAG